MKGLPREKVSKGLIFMCVCVLCVYYIQDIISENDIMNNNSGNKNKPVITPNENNFSNIVQASSVVAVKTGMFQFLGEKSRF